MIVNDIWLQMARPAAGAGPLDVDGRAPPRRLYNILMHAGSTGFAGLRAEWVSQVPSPNIGTLLAQIPLHIHPPQWTAPPPLSPQPDRKKFSGKFPQPLTYAKQIYKYIFIIKPDERLALAARRRARV